MFFHLFKNTFLIDRVPNEIASNFKVKNASSLLGLDASDILNNLYQLDIQSKQPTFYTITEDSVMNNNIIREYCMKIGFDHEIYSCIIDYSDWYTKYCVLLYEPEYEDPYKRIEKRRFSYVSQSYLNWSYHNLPQEYLINHLKSSEAEHLLSSCNSFRSLLVVLKDIIPPDKLEILEKQSNQDMLFDPSHNLCFDTEFSFPLFNKKLLFLLKKRKFTLYDIPADVEVTLEDIREYIKEQGGKPNYDNQSIF